MVMNERANEGVPQDVRFADLVDARALQSLMDRFTGLTGIANAIVDLDGAIIAHSGWQRLCTRFHRVHPATRQRCIESDTSLASCMTKGQAFATYRCPNGLVETASPVVVDGRHMANVFAGQFFVEPPDLAFFRRQAAEFGFDEMAYLAAVSEVPIVTSQTVEAVIGVQVQFAQLLASSGMDRLRQLAAERSLEARTRELEAANKELEDFSYSMSHDMRTPLRAIDGFARILAEEHADRLDEEGKRLIGVVRRNALRMGCLIDDILRFLRVGRHRLVYENVDMTELVREVFDDLHMAAPDRDIRLDLGELPCTWGDRELLRRVVSNLLSNAMKFSPPDRTALIEVQGGTHGNESVFSVKDHGVGFDMRYVEKLFRVFERVHPTGQFEGSAVGLAVVKRIVGLHGGRVWAEGSVGAGATFWFALPCRNDAAAGRCGRT